MRPLVLPMHGQQARDTFHHHFTRFVLGLPNESDAGFRVGKRYRAHPFGTGARFAGAASAENQPGGPALTAVGKARRTLMVMCESIEFAAEIIEPMRRKPRQNPRLRRLAQRRPIL